VLTSAAALPAGKNWAPPAYRLYAQALCDRAMVDHPELLSITFHGSPPGKPQIYTMFAGSFPDRIGNIDTIVDPRWQRRDGIRKLVGSRSPVCDEHRSDPSSKGRVFRSGGTGNKGHQADLQCAAGFEGSKEKKLHFARHAIRVW
jgi:hypothetical protein